MNIREEVEAKLREFRKLVGEMWEKGDFMGAIEGDKLIKAVEENIDATKRLRLSAKALKEIKL